MDLNTIKEEFSYAYVKMIAAVTGYEVIVTGRPSDAAGIDITIRAPGNINGVFSPTIDAQVKCTSREVLKKDYLKYPLPIKNYKRLISIFSQAPQILIIVLFPDDLNDTLTITSASTVISKCAYWISLKGKQETNNDETITINIPLNNVLLPETLKNIMETHANRLNKLFKLEDLDNNLEIDEG